MLEFGGFKSLEEVDCGLRTYIGGLVSAKATPALADKIHELDSRDGIFAPCEGELSPFLQNGLFRALKLLGYVEVSVGDEFGRNAEVRNLNELMECDAFQKRNQMFTADGALLVSTHWDSHCSFLCGARELVERIVAMAELEGFFCGDDTNVYWGVS